MSGEKTSARRGSGSPFPDLLDASRAHRREHGCGAYSFEDGAGLAALCARLRPDRVLELGTALGYSACCIASGYSDAHIDTVEADPAHCTIARRHFAQAGLQDRIRLHVGEFQAVLPTLTEPYNLAFFDGFAPSRALTVALQAKLAAGGALVCANLGLASTADAVQIRALFADSTRWRTLAPLEAGATPVWVKT